MLHSANLGDSGFMVVRQNDVVFKSPSQQHSFNFPFQLGRGGRGSFDPPISANVNHLIPSCLTLPEHTCNSFICTLLCNGLYSCNGCIGKALQAPPIEVYGVCAVPLSASAAGGHSGGRHRWSVGQCVCAGLRVPCQRDVQPWHVSCAVCRGSGALCPPAVSNPWPHPAFRSSGCTDSCHNHMLLRVRNGKLWLC